MGKVIAAVTMSLDGCHCGRDDGPGAVFVRAVPWDFATHLHHRVVTS